MPMWPGQMILAGGVNFLGGGFAHGPDGPNLAVGDQNVGRFVAPASRIDDPAEPYEQGNLALTACPSLW